MTVPSLTNWYEQTLCFFIRSPDEISSPTQAQIDTMKTIYLCIALATTFEVFNVAQQDRFVSCMFEHDLDPGSPAVLEWLSFYPPEVCWPQEVLDGDVDESDIDLAEIWNPPEGGRFASLAVCVAVWPETDAGISIAARNVYMCILPSNISFPSDDMEVIIIDTKDHLTLFLED